MKSLERVQAMDFAGNSEDPRTSEALIRDLERMHGVRCTECRTPLCNHHILISIVLGFKNSARCLECLGLVLQRDPLKLRDSLYSYIRQRECHRTAWEWASKTEGVELDSIPSCLGNHGRDRLVSESISGQETHDPASPSELVANMEWNAGEMGCGDLVLELRIRLQSMKSGEIMKLQARDPGAPEDLPAWCRLTGHTLVHAHHPTYWIRRKE